MDLKVTFNKEASIAQQMAIVRKMEADVMQSMRYVGEKFVRDARQMTKAQGGFGDVTGNLRSSIGYFIVKNGEVLVKEINEQRQIAKVAAEAVLKNVGKSSKLKLVGVAGMEYASAVESKGYNVISIQADVAIIDLSGYFKTIESKYK